MSTRFDYQSVPLYVIYVTPFPSILVLLCLEGSLFFFSSPVFPYSPFSSFCFFSRHCVLYPFYWLSPSPSLSVLLVMQRAFRRSVRNESTPYTSKSTSNHWQKISLTSHHHHQNQVLLPSSSRHSSNHLKNQGLLSSSAAKITISSVIINININKKVESGPHHSH